MDKTADSGSEEAGQGLFGDLDREYERKIQEPEESFAMSPRSEPDYSQEAVPLYPDLPTPGSLQEQHKSGASVPLLIDLQDGFSNDTVIIEVNGQVVYGKKGISTNYAISLADSAEVQVPPGSVRVEISVPSRQLTTHEVFNISATTNLWISLLGNKIHSEISDKQAFYM